MAFQPMKKSQILLLSSILFITQLAQSEGLEPQIKSGSYCKLEVYDKFKLIEKTNHKRLKFNPESELLELVVSMELMCPWSTQRDFNGDKKKDWVGYVSFDENYQLIAYLSGQKQHKIQILSESKQRPANSFIKWIQTKQLKRFTDKKLAVGQSKYALQVSALDGMTDFYLWDGKQLAKVLTTPQMF